MELEGEIRQLDGSQIMLDIGCYFLELGLSLVGDRGFGRVEDKGDILSFSFGLDHCDRGHAKLIGR